MIINAIWDLDGTLYNTYPGILKALCEILRTNGAEEVVPAKVEEMIKRTSVHAVLKDFTHKRGLDYLTVLHAYDNLEHAMVMAAKPFAETKATLQAVVGRGGNNLLMTHRDNTAWALLARDKFDKLFLGGVTADLHLKRKPDPEALLYLIKRHQLNPARTAMIGDRRLDIVAAKNAHIQGVYFNIDDLNDAPMADFQVDHLHEIVPLIGNPSR